MSVSALLEHMPIGQSALSQHLAKLRAANVVAYRRQAQVLHYGIHNPDVGQLIATLKNITALEAVIPHFSQAREVETKRPWPVAVLV